MSVIACVPISRPAWAQYPKGRPQSRRIHGGFGSSDRRFSLRTTSRRALRGPLTQPLRLVQHTTVDQLHRVFERIALGLALR